MHFIGSASVRSITGGNWFICHILASDWSDAGVTHFSVNTMRAGLKGPDQHIEAIRRFKEAVG